jgi:hypothetical protein
MMVRLEHHVMLHAIPRQHRAEFLTVRHRRAIADHRSRISWREAFAGKGVIFYHQCFAALPEDRNAV